MSFHHSAAFVRVVVLVTFALLSVPFGPAVAADPSADPALESEIPEGTELIVVSATRGAHDLSTLPMSATVHSGKELDEAPDYALDGVLRNVPGVFVTTRSSAVTHPTAQQISMRGLGGSRSLVLLDGVPVNDGFGGWINWSKLPIRNLERVDVVRGAGASLWGNYAMGGVVNVVTRPADERAVIARGSYGSFDTGTADAYVSDATGDTGVSLRYRFFDTDGYKVVAKGQRGSVDREASSRSHFLDGRIDHAFSDSTLANLTLTLFDEDRNVGTPITDNSRKSLDSALRLTHDAEEFGQFRLSIFGSAQQFDNNNSCVDPPPVTDTCREGPRASESRIIEQDIPTGQVGAFFEWSKGFEPWDALLTAGLDFQHVQARNREELFAPYPDPGSRTTSGKQETLGGYLQAELYPLEDLEVLASVRVDYWRTFDGERRSNRGLPTDGLTRFRDQSEVEVSPRLSLRYAVDESLALRGGVYRAFRAPNLNELYRGFFAGGRVFSGNPELGSELLRIGGELGFDWTVGPATLHVTGYWNELDDFIDFVFSGGGFVRQNFTQVRARGVEIELPIQLTETILIAPSYVFADSTIQKFGTTGSSRVGNQIRNVPRNTFLFTARYDDPDWFRLEFLGRYIGVSYGDDRNTDKLEPHFVLDVSLSRKLGEHWEVFLMAQNITDEEYVARRVGDLGTIGVPQNFWGGIRYDW